MKVRVHGLLMALWKLTPTQMKPPKRSLTKNYTVYKCAPELTKNLGATAIQGHAVTDGDDN